MKLSPTIRAKIQSLEKHALSLAGTTRGVDDAIQLIAGSWPDILDIDYEPACIARIPVLKKRLRELSSQHPEVVESEWMERDGHVYMEVALDSELSATVMKGWIDDAYRLILNKLDADERFLVIMGDRPYEEDDVIKELVDFYELRDIKKKLYSVSKKAVLLRTARCAEKNIPVGASKIGGNPDLPASTDWPTHSSGKPLAFLAQFDLRELTQVGLPFKSLPTQGMLSIFSAWGWMVDGDADPHVPAEDETPDWTKCIHLQRRNQLERRKCPRGTHRFKSTPFTPIAIRSFPMHLSEPSIKTLGWNPDQCERYQKFADTFLHIQLRRFAPNSHGSWHQLGGYGHFQQYLPDKIQSGKHELFLQLGTDDWASDMMWGDGGELSLIGPSNKMRRGIFDTLIGEVQGG